MGGTSFTTKEALELKTRLQMKFNLPIPALRLVYGTIVRRREVRPRQYECGIVFDPLNPEEAVVLKQHVMKLLEPD